MAVPKKKISKSKQKMRRSHLALKKVNIVFDQDTGEPRLPHHIDATSGDYNKRNIIIQKTEEVDSAE